MSFAERGKDYRIPFGVGMLLFLFAGVWDTQIELVRYLLALTMVVGGGLMAWGLHIRNREEGLKDERFLINRLKASRVALIVALISILGLMAYEWMINRILHWEFVVIVGAIAVVKVAAMLYYQKVG